MKSIILLIPAMRMDGKPSPPLLTNKSSFRATKQVQTVKPPAPGSPRAFAMERCAESCLRPLPGKSLLQARRQRCAQADPQTSASIRHLALDPSSHSFPPCSGPLPHCAAPSRRLPRTEVLSAGKIRRPAVPPATPPGFCALAPSCLSRRARPPPHLSPKCGESYEQPPPCPAPVSESQETRMPGPDSSGSQVRVWGGAPQRAGRRRQRALIRGTGSTRGSG